MLMGLSRSLAHGDSVAWTFLIRTPELVEEGVRRVLAQGLAGEFKVEKRGCTGEAVGWLALPR
jgi:hypothetical protein